MTEERLKEIKDSIDFQLSVCDIPEYETSKLLAEEELELYNEVVELRNKNENFRLLLERAKSVVPTYYNELLNDINKALKK